MPADDLTPSQVAELLGVDASSLRRWARAYRAHLSTQAQGKRRRYSSADLATLSRAKDLLRAGKSPAEVERLLATVPADAPQLPAVANVSLPAMAGELQATQEALRAALGRLDAMQASQEALQAAQTAQAGKLAALEAELAAWRALPWWRRVFGPKGQGGG